jgi:hypothetical protein
METLLLRPSFIVPPRTCADKSRPDVPDHRLALPSPPIETGGRRRGDRPLIVPLSLAGPGCYLMSWMPTKSEGPVS